MSKKQYIYSQQESLWGDSVCLGFGSDDFYVKEIDRSLADKTIIDNHYSKKVVVFGHHKLDIGVFENGLLIGVLQYGYAMNPQSCGSVVEGATSNEYYELNRMWISDDIKTKYPESRAISYSIKYIKRKNPKIKWIQSFADERCGGFGIVYQACSFNYYGEHSSIFWELDGEFIHNSRFTNSNKKSNNKYAYYKSRQTEATKHQLRQFRYIKFLDQREKKKCLLKEKPYPKHYNND